MTCALIVEDEPFIAIDLQQMVMELGFEDVRAAHNLAAAHGILDDVTPDFAILDVNIGDQLVFPFAELLRARNVALILSTGRHAIDIPAEWSDVPLLPKPIDGDKLKAAIAALGVMPTRKPARNRPPTKRR